MLSSRDLNACKIHTTRVANLEFPRTALSSGELPVGLSSSKMLNESRIYTPTTAKAFHTQFSLLSVNEYHLTTTQHHHIKMQVIIVLIVLCFAASAFAFYDIVEDDQGQEYYLLPLRRERRYL